VLTQLIESLVIGNESSLLVESLVEGLDLVELCSKMTLIYVLRVVPKKKDIFLDNYCRDKEEPGDEVYDEATEGEGRCSHFSCKDRLLTNLDKLYFRIAFKVFLIIEQLVESLPELNLLEGLGFKKVEWNSKWGPMSKKMARKAVIDGAINKLCGFESPKLPENQGEATRSAWDSGQPLPSREAIDRTDRIGALAASAGEMVETRQPRPGQAREEQPAGLLEQVVRVWFQQCKQFFSSYVGSVEVLAQSGQIVKVHFQIPYCCKYTSAAIKRAVLHDVSRASDQERLEDFFARRKLYEFEMTVLQRLSFHPFLFALVASPRLLRLLHFIALLTLNGFVLFCHFHPSDASEKIDRQNVIIDSSGKSPIVLQFPSQYYEYAFRLLQGLQLLLLLLSTAIAIFQTFPTALHASLSKLSSDAKTTNSFPSNNHESPSAEVHDLSEVLKRTSLLRKTALVFTNFNSSYNLAVIALSLLAVAYSNLLYSLLLLEVLWVSPPLLALFRTLLREHFAQAGLAALIALISVFFFSVIGFYYFQASLDQVGTLHSDSRTSGLQLQLPQPPRMLLLPPQDRRALPGRHLRSFQPFRPKYTPV
jgi:hypothetical protein